MSDPVSQPHALLFLLAAVSGYLCGSIPFGLLLTQWAGLGDIRKVGSGNIGATNVLRTGKRSLALATLLLDGLKAFVPTIIASRFGPNVIIIAAGAAFLGHLYPAWLKFHGGKGVACYFGVLFALDWPVALMAAGTWLVTAALFRFSSLAALITAVVTPAYFWLTGELLYAELMAAIAILVILKHRPNIERLLTGEESKIGG